MAELSTLARPYAEAIFRLANENNTLTDWSERLATFAAIVVDSRMQAVVTNPNISAQRAAELIGTIADADLSGKNLLAVLADNDRLALLPEIHAQYEVLKAEAEGVLKATIVTALEISEEQKADIVSALKTKFNRDVQATVKVDPSLIGGAMIVVGDRVIDGTVKGRLQKMAAALAA